MGNEIIGPEMKSSRGRAFSDLQRKRTPNPARPSGLPDVRGGTEQEGHEGGGAGGSLRV